jgi:predicted nucleic acid-binding protein
MTVVFDASILLLAIDSKAKPPAHPDGPAHAGQAGDRVRYLLERLDALGAIAIIPTPALTELLTRAGAATTEILETLQRTHRVQIAAFDQRSAIECAVLLAQPGGKRNRRQPAASWAKVKFDHQIIAIAKVHGATQIYSDDQDLKKLGTRAGMEVLGVWDLPARPDDPQGKLPLDTKADSDGEN